MSGNTSGDLIAVVAMLVPFLVLLAVSVIGIWMDNR